MKYHLIWTATAVMMISACGDGKPAYDASGNFEADEVIVSAQQNGEILSFPVNEGDKLNVGQVIGQIDVTIPALQQQQVQASIQALRQKTNNPQPQALLVERQLVVQEAQLQQLYHERKRTENLVKSDAATQKQLDDMNAQVDQLEKQLNVTRQQRNLYNSNIATQNRSILSEQVPLEKSMAQFAEQVRKGQIINPVAGVVLSRYALKGEMATVGKPLYKIANIDTLYLKAYVTGITLPNIKLGQEVQVRIDQGKKDYKSYPGTITWISDKSEFTPKTIQTKNERANLVYAIKVRVKNDGYLKIGMYGEMLIHQ
ncbi:HlyD family efflux transporter periplasmic adaptor subunit [Chitinophaga varians]|uniref:HlyD family efflux transporter periplasmic adaptor subunit n=1 Tax=Chitinophaga varians TaxID=2202339 RepID=A0A847RZ57_9BACT|nr:HlyD family efflux transporter periplasmic adaptor subunit [Chitinophaga varians]NLR66395.1 HlyD family efflux transporter periplasmic adaptor subunit [Chitinophaga varians]